MRTEDYDEFAALLDAVYDMIGSGANKTISPQAKALFFQALASYPLPAVRAALSAHCKDRKRGQFTPKPADVIEQIEAMAMRDTRPGAEEAWALALATLDDQKTVVWTQEAAEAFGKARPVLDASGPISARKTFIEIYERLVIASRADRIAPTWFPSPGLDHAGYAREIGTATTAGLLPAPAMLKQLAESTESPRTSSPREQLDELYRMIEEGAVAKQRRLDNLSVERIEAEKAISAAIQRDVDQYEAQSRGGLQV